MSGTKPSYKTHWTLVAAAAAAFALRLWLPWPAPAPEPGADASGADWYLVLRLPLLGENEERARLELERLRGWVEELKREGFAPVLLSEARARLARGERLPGKPVVLLLEPGYRRAVESAHPFLSGLGAPSVWLVDGEAVERRDERFVSPHALSRLRRAGLTDVGLLQGSTWTFTLAGETLSWGADAGRRAINRGGRSATIRRLHVPLAWTGRQLAARLQAEVPVGAPGRLGVVRLYGRPWGVAARPGSPAPFDLHAPLNARSASVSWLGSEGRGDAELELTAASVTGDLWLYPRWRPGARKSLRVGYTAEGVVAEEGRNGRWRRVGAVPWARGQATPLSARLRLKGSRLSVTVGSAPARDFELGARPGPGCLLLELHDKIRGGAGARALELTWKPS